MRRSQQAFSVPSKQTQSSNAKDELSSTASINASSTTLIPSSKLLASKPRDCTLKREQNSCYEHDNGLTIEERLVRVTAGSVTIEGNLNLPEKARAVVLFAHGSGSSRHSSRNRYVARLLNEAKLATLLIDLLNAAGRGDRPTYGIVSR